MKLLSSIAVLMSILPMFGSGVYVSSDAHVATIPISSEPACPQGWSLFQSYCYLASSSIKTRPDAQSFCQHRGGELVKINSEEENEFVLQLVRKKASSARQVWIGLQFVGAPVNEFYWSDFSVPVFTKFSFNEPNGFANEPCVQMFTGNTNGFPLRASGNWNDLTCETASGSFANGLVCKKLAH